MPRGRPTVAKSPTKFLNTKRRVIYRTAAGKYVATAASGAAVYNPKAKYVKSPGGTERAVKYLKNMTIPSPIRPKMVRQVRKNYGDRRGKYAPRVKGVRVLPVKRKAYIAEMFEGYKPKRAAGRPRKHLVSPGANMGLAALFGGKPVRKMRANKGMRNANPFAGLMR